MSFRDVNRLNLFVMYCYIPYIPNIALVTSQMMITCKPLLASGEHLLPLKKLGYFSIS